MDGCCQAEYWPVFALKSFAAWTDFQSGFRGDGLGSGANGTVQPEWWKEVILNVQVGGERLI